MARPRKPIPDYRKHNATGRAVVTINGHDHYLGKYGTAASRLEYNRLIGELRAGGGTLPVKHDLTINELLVAFFRHAKTYYRKPDGTPTTGVQSFKQACKPLKELYGKTPVSDFGPLKLKAVREQFVESDASRNYANQCTNRVRQIFKWGVENELVPPVVLQGLQAVAGLRAGRTAARETEPIRPVPEQFVDAVMPYVSPQVAAMIDLQRITGMRSGEVVLMRGCDIDTTGKVWIYTLATHKTAWHGHERKVYLGPKAQAVVKPFLLRDTTAYLFSPAEAESEGVVS